MIKTFVSALCAAALTAATFVIPFTAAPASAQVSGSYTCEARSAYALGVGISFDGNAACRRALAECSVRTPYGYYCYVTRWWVN